MLDQMAIVSPSFEKPLPHVSTGMKLIPLPHAACRFASVLADAL